jgi:uncharacterized protein YkwD
VRTVRSSALIPIALVWVGCGDGGSATPSPDAGAGADAGSDAGAPDCPGGAKDEWDAAWAAMEADLLVLVNATRAAGADCGEGLVGPVGAIEMDASLQAAARAHARDMADNDFVGLRGSDGSTFQERHERCGWAGKHAQGADLAAGAPLPEDALDRWLGTPTGCALLLDARWSSFGAGYRPESIWVVAYAEP